MRLLALLAAIVVSVGLTACGGDDEEGGGSGSAAGEGAATSGPPVKLGIIASKNSPIINSEDAMGAAQAAVNAINDRGGLDGRKIELIICNEKNDAAQGAKCARDMVAEGIAATVGGHFVTGQSITPVLEAAGIPMIGVSPVGPTEFQSPNVYPFMPGGNYETLVMSAYAAHEGTPSSLVATSAATQLDPLKKTYAEAGGGPLPQVSVPPTTTDWAPLVQAAARDGAKNAIMYVQPSQGLQFVQAAESTGADFDLYLFAELTSKHVEDAGSAADKLISASAFPPLDDPDVPLLAEYNEEIEAEHEKGNADADPATARETSLAAWLSVRVVEQLAKNIDGEITAENLTAELNAAKDLDMGGIIPPWTPNAKGPKDAPRLANRAVYLTGFKADGTPELITREPVTVEQAIAGEFG